MTKKPFQIKNLMFGYLERFEEVSSATQCLREGDGVRKVECVEPVFQVKKHAYLKNYYVWYKARWKEMEIK